MRTFLAHQLAQQHPLHDPHPLAREDGGWYPGKHFDPTDILTDPKNWTVWKQFLLFFFGILCVPVLSFIGVEWILRVLFHLKFQQSQTIGAIVAIIVLQIFMISYARRAVLEEHADYAEQQAARQKAAEDGGPEQDTRDSTSQEAMSTKIEGKSTSQESASLQTKIAGESMTQEATSREDKITGEEGESTLMKQARVETGGGAFLAAEDRSSAKEGETASIDPSAAQEEPMPEKLDSDLGVGGQVKKRK